jgi:hypothetical protein
MKQDEPQDRKLDAIGQHAEEGENRRRGAKPQGRNKNGCDQHTFRRGSKDSWEWTSSVKTMEGRLFVQPQERLLVERRNNVDIAGIEQAGVKGLRVVLHSSKRVKRSHQGSLKNRACQSA